MIDTPIYEELKRTLDTDAVPGATGAEDTTDGDPVATDAPEPSTPVDVQTTDDPIPGPAWAAPNS